MTLPFAHSKLRRRDRATLVCAFCLLIAVTLVTFPTISSADGKSKRFQLFTSKNFIAQDTRYSKDGVHFIKKSISLTKDLKESALLRGLLWLAHFVDQEDRFVFVFSDVVVMLAELAREKNFPRVATASALILEDVLKRGAYRLALIFSPDEVGRWEFVSILPYILDSEARKREYYRFYRQQFTFSFEDDLPAYRNALKSRDYDLLGDYLIDYAFLELLKRKHPDFPIGNTKNALSDFTKLLVDLPFPYSYGDDEYYDQNYFVTHIVFAQTLYGAIRPGRTAFDERVHRYLQDHLSVVRYKTGDLDLLGEYLNCLKLYGDSGTKMMLEATTYLLSKQHESGAWGEASDFRGDPYDQFHPTWAVMTGLADMSREEPFVPSKQSR